LRHAWRRTWLAGLAILVLAGFRLLALATGSGPATVDAGNWLAFAHDLLGDGVRSGVVYPPIVPLGVAACVTALGPTLGVAVAGTIAWAVAPLALWFHGRRAGAATMATVAAIVAGATTATGEVLAWGGFPQLLAVGAVVVAMPFAVTWLREGGRRSLCVVAVGYGVIAFTSHLVLVPALSALALAVVLGALIGRPGSPGTPRRAAVLAALVAIVILPMVPVYVAILESVLVTGPGTRLGWADVTRVLGAGWLVWCLAMTVAPVVLASLRMRRVLPGGLPGDLLVAAAALAMAWLATIAATGEVRFLHDVGVIASLSVLAGVIALRAAPASASFAREMIVAVALLGGVASSLAGIAAFGAQVDYYRVLDPATEKAVVWLGANTAGDAVVAVPDHAGTPLWWVEGLAQRRALLASELRWLRFPDERARAVAAATLFYDSDFPSPASVARAAQSGVSYILLPDIAPWNAVDLAAAPAPWRIAYARDGVIVIDTGYVQP